MKPFLIPKIALTRKVNLSLDEVAKRFAGEPNLVRVGLPDSKTADEGNQRRRERRAGRRSK